VAKKAKTKAEIAHHGRVVELGCYIGLHFPQYRRECGGRNEVHHQTGQGRDHLKCMCLCTNHHSPMTPLPLGCAVHKGKKIFEKRYATQEEMVAWTNEQVGIE
jgi:hypothetical protein